MRGEGGKIGVKGDQVVTLEDPLSNHVPVEFCSGWSVDIVKCGTRLGSAVATWRSWKVHLWPFPSS